MHNVNTGPLELKPGVNCEAFALIGSQVIPGAATETSDHDVAILLIEGVDRDDMFEEIVQAAAINLDPGNDCIISDGEGYEEHGDGMTSCKVWRGETIWNYLVFTDADYFDKFVDATTIARRFGVVDKPFRVELFQLLCDGYRKKESHFDHIEIHRSQEVPF